MRGRVGVAFGRIIPNSEKENMSQTIKPVLQDEPSYKNFGRLKQGSVQDTFPPPDFMQQILPEDVFLTMLGLERKRAERSNKKFLLLLLDADDATSIESRTK